MALVMTSGPAGEPVSLADVKAHLHIDGTDHDTYLGSLILTSRLQIETALGLALMTQSWRMTLSAWPSGRIIALPIRPIAAIDGLGILAPDGTLTPLPLSGVQLDPGPPAVAIAPLSGWPAALPEGHRVALDFTAGYGPTAATVPAPIRHALLLLTAHWFEHRDPSGNGESASIPPSVSDLLLPYRSHRL